MTTATSTRPLFPLPLCPNIRRPPLGKVHASRPTSLGQGVVAWCGTDSLVDLRALPTSDAVTCDNCHLRADREGVPRKGNRAPVDLTAARQRLFLRAHEQVLAPYRLPSGWWEPGRSDGPSAHKVNRLQRWASSMATGLQDPAEEAYLAEVIDELIAPEIALLWGRIDTTGPDFLDFLLDF